MSRRGALALLALSLVLACFGPRIDRPSEIDAALADLAAGGFSFAADVAFGRDAYVMCDRVSCTELRIVRGRRTVLLAHDAFESTSRLRASLLDMWSRYQDPVRISAADQARSAQRILEDGPRVGVTDPELLREVRQLYRRLYGELSLPQRSTLPSPDELPYP